jgi:DNA-binding SARP family transcriptional activator
MGILWPDKAPDKARHSLSQTLYELRKELGEDWLEVTGEVLRTTDAMATDVEDFRAAVEGQRDTEALDHYGGGFLDGTSLGGTRDYEGWIDRTRARLARDHRKAAARAVASREQRQDVEGALDLARRWVDRDPLDDEAQHALIALLARAGRRSEALRQYDRYAALLERELEVEPLEGTRELIAGIRRVGRGTHSQGEPAVKLPAQPPAASPPPPSPESQAGRPEGPSDDTSTSAPDSIPDSNRRRQGRESMLDGLIALADELRRRRVNRVAIGYLVVGFAALEGADLILTPLGAPPWIQAVLAVLVVLGFPAVLAIAWVFDITPHGLEVTQPAPGGSSALAAAVAKRGLLAIVALSLLGLGAVWSWQQVREAPVFDVNRVMVFPLVTPPESPVLQASVGEDVATIIGHALDRTGPLRWIDGWSLLPPEERNDVRELTNDEARALATSRACAFYVTGRVVHLGERSTVFLDLWDAEGDSIVAVGEASGPSGRSWEAGLQAVRPLLPSIVGEDIPGFGQEVLSREPAAVASFLLGERAFRRGRSDAALAHYDAAVAEDSVFVMATIRGAQAAAWAHRPDDAEALLGVALALELREVDRHFALGMQAYLEGRGDSAKAAFDRAVALDDASAIVWMQLGEVHAHLAPRTAQPDSVVLHAFGRAREIDDHGVTTLFHVLEQNLAWGRLEEAEPLLQAFMAQVDDPTLEKPIEIMNRCARRTMTVDEWIPAFVADRQEALWAAKKFAAGGRNVACAEGGFRAALLAPSGPSRPDRQAAFLGLQAILLNRGDTVAARELLFAATRSFEEAQALVRDPARAAEVVGKSFVTRPSDDGVPNPLEGRAMSLLLVEGAMGVDLGQAPAEMAGSLRERLGPNFASAHPSNFELWRLAIHEAHRGNAEALEEIAAAMEANAVAAAVPLAEQLAQAVRGHQALALGDTVGALGRLSGLRSWGSRTHIAWSYADPLPFERVVEARLRLAGGATEDLSEAFALASTLDGDPLGYTLYLAESLAIRIEAAEGLGLTAQARQLRQRLASLRGETLDVTGS